MQTRDPPWHGNPGQTIPEVQNRSISGPSKFKDRHSSLRAAMYLQFQQGLIRPAVLKRNNKEKYKLVNISPGGSLLHKQAPTTFPKMPKAITKMTLQATKTATNRERNI